MKRSDFGFNEWLEFGCMYEHKYSKFYTRYTVGICDWYAHGEDLDDACRRSVELFVEATKRQPIPWEEERE